MNATINKKSHFKPTNLKGAPLTNHVKPSKGRVQSAFCESDTKPNKAQKRPSTNDIRASFQAFPAGGI